MADDDWAKAVDEQERAGNLANQVQNIKIGSAAPTPSPVKATPGATSTPHSVPAAPNAGSDDGDEQKDADANRADASLLNKMIRSKLVTTKADLEILQKDPNSPLYSVKSFEALNLKPELLKGIYDRKFNAPSKIQETALPALLADPPQNMIAQSQSGTGKTAAFVLTMLSRVDCNQKHPQCLCLAPTYELAMQIGEDTKNLSKFMPDVGIIYAVRGERVNRGEKLTEQIVIGTPGTVLDWSIKFKVLDLKKINVFVLDEADVMIDSKQGHQDQSIRIQRNCRKDCQMLLFSATYDQRVMKFAQAIVPDPVTIKLRRDEESLDNIKQYYINCRDQQDKFEALSNIYGSISIGQTMIFCHTRRTANWLVEKMIGEGHAVALLTGELDVSQRAAIIQRFKAGKEKILITTNVTARGIDVEQVTVVVNFDLPMDMQYQPDFETYLHRIGRTGRFGKQGIAINMVDGNRSMKILEQIQAHFNRKIVKLDADDIDEIEKIKAEG